MKTRLYVAGILGGIGLLAITLIVVIAFGRHHPSPPLLKDNPKPQIPGEILYQDRDGCFVIVRASGAGEERLGCSFQKGPIGQEFWWVDDNTVRWVLHSSPTSGQVIEVNIRTGVQRETGETIDIPQFGGKRFPAPYRDLQDCLEGPDGTLACIDNDGKLAMVEGETVTRIAKFDLPKYNRPHIKGWAPDSQWVVLEYHPQRADGPELWIISRDGSVRGTLTKDVTFTRIAWRIQGAGTWPPLPD